MTIDQKTATDTSAKTTFLDNLVIRSKESFAFAKEISKPYGGLDSVITWCKSEIAGDWRWQLVQASTDFSPGRYLFYFDDERDYVAFLLKWA